MGCCNDGAKATGRWWQHQSLERLSVDRKAREVLEWQCVDYQAHEALERFRMDHSPLLRNNYDYLYYTHRRDR